MKITALHSPNTQKWAKLFAQFLSGQVVIQSIAFLTGFLLLRWLSVTQYAQFSIAFAFQSTLGALIDLGFSNSIVALVGDRGADGNIIGNYIRSAKHFRNRMFVVVISVALVAFPFITGKQAWSLSTKLLLFAAVAASLFFQGWGMYAAPLLINRRIKPFYRAQVFSATGRILICFALHALGLLSAWMTSWVAALVLAWNGLLYRRAANALISEPPRGDPQFNREMVRYLAPLIPGVVFAAFQGQIAIMLITYFGQTKNIAEVAALGRLAQIFALLAACNSVVVEPFIARVAAPLLARRYCQIAALAVIVSISFTVGAFRFPEAVLWLLGKNYAHLQNEVGWVVLAGCINYVSGVLWTMNSARKWIWWWGTGAYIGLLIVSQTACVLCLNLSVTHNVIIFGVITSVVVLLVHLATMACGLYRVGKEQDSVSRLAVEEREKVGGLA